MDLPSRALSIRQPWADAIVYGEKRVENRGWAPPSTAIGAPLLVHASQHPIPGALPATMTAAWPGTLGAIIGTVQLTGVHRATGGCCAPWGEPDAWHWELTQPRPLPDPIPCPGRLRLWTPPPQVLQQLAHATPTASAASVPYHDAHTPYIRAVAKALAALGVAVHDWDTMPDDPRTAHITLDTGPATAAYGDADVGLLWSEESGWAIAWDTRESGRYEALADLGDDVLPTPQTLAELTRDALTTRPAPLHGRWATYRDFGDNDNFEDRLTTYHD
ncbi:hypothetical protein AQ490_06525 [Wenjunlia vitaminophila]|uniref:DUF6292 domain-containing protein n=2 Tax=Wenjunlia vitaminophila TaxID=76728 RepID=A0A0T6LN77_WENVI|nr:DUF6292 family protein [Wenjunlia vitaminophila]KRV47547.1 hypothetical protein AQ490_06525 [Wenjunlia vitaminophila]